MEGWLLRNATRAITPEYAVGSAVMIGAAWRVGGVES